MASENWPDVSDARRQAETSTLWLVYWETYPGAVGALGPTISDLAVGIREFRESTDRLPTCLLMHVYNPTTRQWSTGQYFPELVEAVEVTRTLQEMLAKQRGTQRLVDEDSRRLFPDLSARTKRGCVIIWKVVMALAHYLWP